MNKFVLSFAVLALINNVAAIKIKDSEKWITNILPSRQFGIIVLSTSNGIISHKEAFTKKTGGKILGFFY